MANSTTKEYLSDGRVYFSIDTSATLDEGNVGCVLNVEADALTLTLPATNVGMNYTIRNAGVAKTSAAAGTGDDESILITIDPNGSDKIMGMELTSVDGVTVVNTKATAKVGDEITLIADGDEGWYIQNVKGIWATGA